MSTVAIIALSAGTLWITSFILRRHYRKGTLSPGRFALVFAGGWSLAVLIFFFGGLTDLLAEARDAGLALLGIGIVALNFALAFGLARVFYSRVISRVSRRPPSSR